MKINLKIKEENTIETIQYEIEEINLLQFQQALQVINDVFSLFETDEKLQNLFYEIMNPPEYENEVVAENQFLYKLGSALDSLLVSIPEKAFKLLSILSGIELDILHQQKLEDVLDIYDAILQVNNVERLVKRAKKSLTITKEMTKGWKIFEKTEQKQRSMKPLPTN